MFMFHCNKNSFNAVPFKVVYILNYQQVSSAYVGKYFFQVNIMKTYKPTFQRKIHFVVALLFFLVNFYKRNK